jgi:hypothetical protein
MQSEDNHLDRRAFLKSATITAAAFTIIGSGNVRAEVGTTATLFDGKTLNGWIQIQNSATSFGSGDVIDLASMAQRLTKKPDGVAALLFDQLDDQTKAKLAANSFSDTDAKALRSTLGKSITKLMAGPLLYEATRFQGITLRPQTQGLLWQELAGRDLRRLNRLLLEDAFPSELAKDLPNGWIVQDGAMASIGTGRGVIYTAHDYTRYRLMFSMRHIYGNPDHQACVLIFCTRPQTEEIPLDALGGIQFQVPNGGHWDYRPGKNTAGGEEFTTILKPGYDPHQWSRVELLVDAERGVARMAVAQPLGAKALEVLSFKDPVAGKTGPIAWQMHNGGLFDEYEDIVIETDPQMNQLTTV